MDASIEELTVLPATPVAFASRLAPGSLLVCGRLDLPEDGDYRGTLATAEESVNVDVRAMRLDPDAEISWQGLSGILLVSSQKLDLEVDSLTLEIVDGEGQSILEQSRPA